MLMLRFSESSKSPSSPRANVRVWFSACFHLPRIHRRRRLTVMSLSLLLRRRRWRRRRGRCRRWRRWRLAHPGARHILGPARRGLRRGPLPAALAASTSLLRPVKPWVSGSDSTVPSYTYGRIVLFQHHIATFELLPIADAHARPYINANTRMHTYMHTHARSSKTSRFNIFTTNNS